MRILPCLLAVAVVAAQDGVVPGDLIHERPTLHSLGFIWNLTGDDNANAACAVAWRRQGDVAWHDSLPLYRLGGDMNGLGFVNNQVVPKGAKHVYTQTPVVIGSVLGLEPGIAYEVRLTLSDPDGVQGEAVRVITATTRPEPVIPTGGEVRHVYPPDWKGAKEEPAYQGIMHAVNGFHPWCDCYQTVSPLFAPPGTVIKVHAGVYPSINDNYRAPHLLWKHGTHTLVRGGTAEKPIAIVAAGDGEVVLDGTGCDILLDVRAADHLIFEGLTLKGARIAIMGGMQGQQCATGLTVRRCRIAAQFGVLAQDGRACDYTITDNTFFGWGPDGTFDPQAHGAWGITKAGYSVNLSGQGHSVCWNTVRNQWDGMNVFTCALPDPAMGQVARAIDFIGNDISNCGDNLIEADGGYANIRIIGNRTGNCGGAAWSNQPVHLGPVYWIRNVLYNSSGGREAFKPDSSAGMLIALHNTCTSHLTGLTRGRGKDIRNNLFLGPVAAAKTKQEPCILNYGNAVRGSVIDHNGHRIGMPGERVFRSGDQGWPTLTAFAAATGFEQHGVEIRDYAIFANFVEPSHAGKASDPLVDPAAVDPRLAAGSPAIDGGTPIAGVNDGFAGAAPDLGAVEFGAPLPHYGPR